MAMVLAGSHRLTAALIASLMLFVSIPTLMLCIVGCDTWLRFGHFALPDEMLGDGLFYLAAFAGIALIVLVLPVAFILHLFHRWRALWFTLAGALFVAIASSVLQLLFGSSWGGKWELQFARAGVGAALTLGWWGFYTCFARSNALRHWPARAAVGLVATCAITAGLLGANAWARAEREAHAAQHPPEIGFNVSGGAATRQTLWLMNVEGKLVAYDRRDWSARVLARSGVKAVSFHAGTLWALKVVREHGNAKPGQELPAGAFELMGIDGAANKGLGGMELAAGESVMGLAWDGGRPLVATTQGVAARQADGSWHKTRFAGDEAFTPRWWGIGSIVLDTQARKMWIGLDNGEWGGGLWRVSLDDGMVERIDQRRGKDLCDGPLNTDCDPVTGVVADPVRKECVLAAVGLRHMIEHGRLLRVCAGTVEVVAEAKSGGPLDHHSTEPFFGLVAGTGLSGGSFALAVTPYALWRVDASGVQREAMPEPTEAGTSGLYLIERPGVVAVITGARGRSSLSGPTPLLIPVHD